jgi:hypothetical protein
MTTEKKYQQAPDLLQLALWKYGIKSPLWDEIRDLVDSERPLVKPILLEVRITYQPGNEVQS